MHIYVCPKNNEIYAEIKYEQLHKYAFKICHKNKTILTTL